jgi:hypothetical protein
MKAQRRPARLVGHLDPRLHAANGNLNAKAIARRLGVSLERLAPALGYTPQGLSRNPAAERLQPRLAEVAHVLDRLRALLADERSIAIWLRAPHPGHCLALFPDRLRAGSTLVVDDPGGAVRAALRAPFRHRPRRPRRGPRRDPASRR